MQKEKYLIEDKEIFMKLMLDSENDLKAVLENTETSIIEENIQDIFVKKIAISRNHAKKINDMVAKRILMKRYNIYQTPIDLKDIETEEKLSKNINRKLISMYSKTNYELTPEDLKYESEKLVNDMKNKNERTQETPKEGKN